MSLKLIQIFTALFFCILSALVVADEYDSLLFGISPQLTKKQQNRWLPLIKYIEKQTNYPLRIQTSATIPVFENRLFAGKFDLAYINPKLYVDARRYVGYQPVVKEGLKKLKGIIVVAKDSPYKTLKDLNGLRFTSPENAFAASVLTRLNLYAQGINFVNSHTETPTQAYATIVAGSTDAAGGVQQTFDSLTSKIKNKLRVLWESDGITPYAFVVHPRVNATVKQRMVEAILDFGNTPEGVAFFKALQMAPFVVAENKDWDDVRQLLD